MAKTNTQTPSKKDRTNTGKRGAKRNPLSRGDLIRMGKGAFRALEPVRVSPWLGTTVIGTPFDAEQAKKNRELGY